MVNQRSHPAGAPRLSPGGHMLTPASCHLMPCAPSGLCPQGGHLSPDASPPPWTTEHQAKMFSLKLTQFLVLCYSNRKQRILITSLLFTQGLNTPRHVTLFYLCQSSSSFAPFPFPSALQPTPTKTPSKHVSSHPMPAHQDHLNSPRFSDFLLVRPKFSNIW